jgi:hypothetical protein
MTPQLLIALAPLIAVVVALPIAIYYFRKGLNAGRAARERKNKPPNSAAAQIIAIIVGSIVGLGLWWYITFGRQH